MKDPKGQKTIFQTNSIKGQEKWLISPLSDVHYKMLGLIRPMSH